MKESTWDGCLGNSSAIEVTPFPPKIKSLIETARSRIVFLKKNKADEANCNFLFEGHYTSALEMLHALALLNGFKVDNHICLGYFLRDAMKNYRLFKIFDDARSKRNALVYYGQRTDMESAKICIKNLGILMEEIGNLIEKS